MASGTIRVIRSVVAVLDARLERQRAGQSGLQLAQRRGGVAAAEDCADAGGEVIQVVHGGGRAVGCPDDACLLLI